MRGRHIDIFDDDMRSHAGYTQLSQSSIFKEPQDFV